MSLLGYYTAATEYLEAAKVIWRTPERAHLKEAKFFLPIHMLRGFSLELFLKAWLKHAGLSSIVLAQKPYGHELEALHREAQRRALSLVHPMQAALVAHLAVEHSAYGYRYMNENHIYELTKLPQAFTR